MQFEWKLPEDWRWATVEKVQASSKRAIVTGPFGSSIGSRFFVDYGVPVIRGNNLSTERVRFIDKGFVYLTEEKADEFKNLEAHPGDLVFTAAGTIGQVGIIPEHPSFKRYIISNKQMRARLNKDVIEPMFAYYWFTEPCMRNHIVSRNTGSTIPLINLGVLRSLPVPLPPLAIQLEIVATVSALDNKITLLRETNTTLEAIAQALFKSWFVDFDPVRTKAEGREPEGVPPEIAALFPSEFENSALGEIPKGWTFMRLDEACDINPTRRLSKGAMAPYLEMASVPTQGHRTETPVVRAFTSGTRFVNGDTLLARITPCLENGKTAFVDFLSEDETGWGSTEYIVLRPRQPLRKRPTAPPIQQKEFPLPGWCEAAATNRFGYSGR